MSKFNLKELGVNYTVLDKTAEQASNMRVIDFVELKAIVGEYVGTSYTNLTPHISAILKTLSGFARSPNDITWYAAKKEDFELPRAIMQARLEKNNIVVVELLPNDDVDNPFDLS